ncbi:MAG: hypothetical protein GWO10_16665 [candidate division Zixibacteria bacterium]|nr:hypothetical protein [Phycisphaerae bacterium]NIR25534.1 hypothetical protein [Gammaproteobacteria bacterium]NIR65356.1 hypothetical protein [candidate division Zixibacteria bacterium]NIW44195.1 hypothetical protein [Gammaproteobacteria bacterium]NIX01277.1 hypothetical protein [Phycisphaerae bacterium]
MRRLTALFLMLGMLVVLQVSPALAADEFQVLYQQMDVVAEPGSVSGLVILNVMNTSGGDVTDLTAAIAGANNILYGTNPVLLGDLADTGQVQIGVPFAADADAGTPEAESTWIMTYTDASGASQTVTVTGSLVD